MAMYSYLWIMAEKYFPCILGLQHHPKQLLSINSLVLQFSSIKMLVIKIYFYIVASISL